MNQNQDGIRRAAILVDCLDRPTADRLLDQMGPEFARLVRQTLVDLDDVDPAEQRRVIDEFLRVEPMVPAGEPAGIDLEAAGRRKSPNAVSPRHPSSPPAASGGSGVSQTSSPSGKFGVPPSGGRKPAEAGTTNEPFQLLRDAEADKLARILTAERPQTVALVLSHLPPEQSGRVLVRLSPQLQSDVIHRLVDLEEADPEVLREVEQALEARLSDHIQMHRRRVAGLSAVAGILEAAGGQAGMEILDNLAAHDRHLADKLGPEPLEFEELIRLGDDALTAILQAADRELLILALVGAPPAVADRFLDQLPQMEAGWIRRELGQLGPIRLGDVTEARRRIADLARRMAAQGRIAWPRRQAEPVSYTFSQVLEPAA